MVVQQERRIAGAGSAEREQRAAVRLPLRWAVVQVKQQQAAGWVIERQIAEEWQPAAAVKQQAAAGWLAELVASPHCPLTPERAALRAGRDRVPPRSPVLS